MSIAIATKLAELEKNLEAQGGWADGFQGVKSLTVFAAEFKPFAEGLNQFVTEMGNIKFDKPFDEKSEEYKKIEAIISIAAMAAKLEKGLEGQGGLEDLTVGAQDLSTFATGISSFGDGIAHFVTVISDLDATEEGKKKVDRAIAIATSINTLAGDLEHLGGSWQGLVGEQNLGTFATQIGELGTALGTFVSNISGNIPDNAEDAVTAMGTINKFVDELSPTGGFFQNGWELMFGSERAKLDELLKELTDMGGSLKQFALDMESVQPKDGEDAIGIFKYLQNFVGQLDKEGGLIQIVGNFFGGTRYATLDEYIGKMKTMGNSLKQFAIDMENVDSVDATEAIAVIEYMKNFVTQLENSGSVWDWFGSNFGSGDKETTFNTYVGLLETLGNKFSTFSSGVKNASVTKTRFNAVKSVLNDFIAYTNELNENGVTVDTSILTTLCSNMSLVPGKLDTFFNDIKDIKLPDNTEDIMKIIKDFSDIAAPLGGISSVYNLGDFIKSLGEDGLYEFDKWVKYIDFDKLKPAYNYVSDIKDIALALNGLTYDKDTLTIDKIIDNAGKSLSAFSTATESIESERLLSMASSVNLFAEAVSLLTGIKASEFGNEYVLNIVTRIQNGSESIQTAAYSLSIIGSNSANGAYQSWYDTGVNLATGIRNGISYMAGSIRSASINAASGAIRAIQVTWAIHSPSKVGENLGGLWDIGIAKGIDKHAKDIEQSSLRTGNTVLDIIGDIDPAIRPVLDLSDVLSGMNTVDNLFSARRDMGLGMFVGNAARQSVSFASSYDEPRQMSSNREVVDAINELTNRFESLSEAVGNMQIVLDSGVLVGQTSKQMDAQLGTLAGRRGRGN